MMDSWESEDDLYTRDEFIERKQMYNATIEKLKERIKDEKQNAPALIDYSEMIKSVHEMIDCLNNPSISAKVKNDFLKQRIERIDYDVEDYGNRKDGRVLLDLYLE